MSLVLYPWHLLLVILAGWINQQRTYERVSDVHFGRLTTPGRHTMLEFLHQDFSNDESWLSFSTPGSSCW